MELNKNDVLKLREMTNAGLSECVSALKKCENIAVAYEYLRLKYSGVCRKKKVGHLLKEWTDVDYINAAKQMAKK